VKSLTNKNIVGILGLIHAIQQDTQFFFVVIDKLAFGTIILQKIFKEQNTIGLFAVCSIAFVPLISHSVRTKIEDQQEY
jgi:hypothetical protein